MKKAVSLLLIFVMVLSFTACGGSGQNTAGAADAQSDTGAKTEAKPTQKATEWDPSKENSYEYENGQVLLENESVRFTATGLANSMSDKGMRFAVNMKMENLSDNSFRIRFYRNGKDRQSWAAKLDPKKSKERGLASIYDWNGKIDAGEDSYLGQYMLRATSESEDIAVLFDLYASETNPFANIITDQKQITSIWGELKDPLGTFAMGGDMDSGDNSSSNETTKDDSSEKPASKEVYIIAALQVNESNNQIWNAVREAVAQEGIDLNLFYQTSQNDMVRAYESGVANMYIGMSKAFFTESPMFLVTPDEIDETARRFEDFLENTCPVGYMSFTPVYLCSDKISSVDELPEGASVNISPNMSSLDSTYMIRSLKLLEKAGLITIKDQSELTGDDYSGFNFYIKDNYKEIKLSRWPVEEILNDLTPFDAFTVLGETYGNVLFEDPFQNDPDYWEQIWVNKELTSDPAILDAIEKIVEAYQSEANLEFVENPVGWDVDLIGQYR